MLKLYPNGKCLQNTGELDLLIKKTTDQIYPRLSLVSFSIVADFQEDSPFYWSDFCLIINPLLGELDSKWNFKKLGANI